MGDNGRTYAEEREYTAIMRGVLLGWWFAHGETFKANQIAEKLGVTRARAWQMMQEASCCIPIYEGPEGWEVCALREMRDLEGL